MTIRQWLKHRLRLRFGLLCAGVAVTLTAASREGALWRVITLCGMVVAFLAMRSLGWTAHPCPRCGGVLHTAVWRSAQLNQFAEVGRPMGERSHEQEKGLFLRAGCAPLVVLSFVLLGVHWLRPWVDLSDSLGFALLTLALCIGAGAHYLLRLTDRPLARLGLVLGFVPLMMVVLWCYGVLFGMLVLGIFP